MYQQQHPQPVTAPPVSPVAAPPAAFAYPPPPPGYPPPGYPQPARRQVRTIVAATVTVMLLLLLIGNGVAVLTVRGDLRGQSADLDRDLAARRTAGETAALELRAEFDRAGLPAKLQAVRDKTSAATSALLTWGQTGKPQSGLRTVREARSACTAAVIDYDATAARFPADILDGLPARIDLTDDTTDCGR